MNNLFFFGDSITFGDNCRKGNDYYEEYYREGDKLWTDIVSDHYNMKSQNLSWPGYSSKSIISSFFKVAKRIKEKDKVIIFKGFYDRIDIPDKNGDYRVITNFQANNGNGNLTSEYFSESDIDLISRYGIRFLYNQEKRYNFYDQIYDYISYTLTEKRIQHLIWEPIDISFGTVLNDDGILTITHHTKGKINDAHFSFPGHVRFSKWLIKKLEKKYIVI